MGILLRCLHHLQSSGVLCILSTKKRPDLSSQQVWSSAFSSVVGYIQTWRQGSTFLSVSMPDEYLQHNDKCTSPNRQVACVDATSALISFRLSHPCQAG